MLKLDIQASFQRKCEKITGDGNAYPKAMEAKDQAKTCISNWVESEKILLSSSDIIKWSARNPKSLISK